jgi:hypothetical protein
MTLGMKQCLMRSSHDLLKGDLAGSLPLVDVPMRIASG